MSSYNTFLKIKNGFSDEMNDGKSEITQGELKTKFPTTIAGGVTTPNIEVDGSNSDDGSAGIFTYEVEIGGKPRKISVQFQCNDAAENFVTGKSSLPELIDVDITPYSPTAHPLRATVTFSLKARQ